MQIFFCPDGFAQQKPALEQNYTNLIRNALNEHKRGNWEEALSLFKQAHQLDPSARTLRGIGMTCFEARKYSEAMTALSLSLKEERKPLTGAMRDQVVSLLERAKGFVGAVELDLAPPSASATVDGHTVRWNDGKFFLDPGERELVVSAEGYRSVSRRIRVVSGETMAIKIALMRTGIDRNSNDTRHEDKRVSVTESTAPKEPDGADESAQDLNLLPWIIVATSGAFVLSGAVLFGIGLHDINDVENVEEGTYYSEIKDADERVPVYTAVGPILFGIGVAGATVGIILLSLDDEEDNASAGISLALNGVLIRGVL